MFKTIDRRCLKKLKRKHKQGKLYLVDVKEEFKQGKLVNEDVLSVNVFYNFLKVCNRVEYLVARKNINPYNAKNDSSFKNTSLVYRYCYNYYSNRNVKDVVKVFSEKSDFIKWKIKL